LLVKTHILESLKKISQYIQVCLAI
jgi:hypothetical protein